MESSETTLEGRTKMNPRSRFCVVKHNITQARKVEKEKGQKRNARTNLYFPIKAYAFEVEAKCQPIEQGSKTQQLITLVRIQILVFTNIQCHVNREIITTFAKLELVHTWVHIFKDCS